MQDITHSFDLDRLAGEILAEGSGDDEQYRAFYRALESNLGLPQDGFLVGEPVALLKVDYQGNSKRGLTGTCRNKDGTEHVVALADVTLSDGGRGAPYLNAYRKWLGVQPADGTGTATSGGLRVNALSCPQLAARCQKGPRARNTLPR
jgi:hypothetical protein